MITQQTASYLIKKMDAAAETSTTSPKDATEELFSFFRESSRPLARIINGNEIDNDAILIAFRWRAAELVSPKVYH
jgi:hypothetical protein